MKFRLFTIAVVRPAMLVILGFGAMLHCLGCSTYTLTRITAVEAHSEGFPEGATYRVKVPRAVLIKSWSTSAIGIGKPSLELDSQDYPEIGRPALQEVPAGTVVKIKQYVRFNQHGFYDCGWDGWQFAIATITEGKLRGTRILIETTCLNRRDSEALLLERS